MITSSNSPLSSSQNSGSTKSLNKQNHHHRQMKPSASSSSKSTNPNCSLPNCHIKRFSRHLLAKGIGIQGQTRISKSRILVVGCGGLGTPVALYLAACGVSTLGLVDFDNVELSNLHRQIGHTEKAIDTPKTHSIAEECLSRNSSIVTWIYNSPLSSLSNALNLFSGGLIGKDSSPKGTIQKWSVKNGKVEKEIKSIFGDLKSWDIICDCTDNVTVRYIIGDSSAILKIPLVYGASIRTAGQITIYNLPDGPCLRCINPLKPPPNSTESCSSVGVFGCTTGVIGTLQAHQALSLAMSSTFLDSRPLPEHISKPQSSESPMDIFFRKRFSFVDQVLKGYLGVEPDYPSVSPYMLPNDDSPKNISQGLLYKKMLLFDSISFNTQKVKIRGKMPNCWVCGTLSFDMLSVAMNRHPQSVVDCCGSVKSTNLVGQSINAVISITKQVSPLEYTNYKESHFLLDVRPKHEFSIFAFPDSINIPIANLLDLNQEELEDILGREKPIFAICRKGQSSQKAVKFLSSKFSDRSIFQIQGGLVQWHHEIDENVPLY